MLFFQMNFIVKENHKLQCHNKILPLNLPGAFLIPYAVMLTFVGIPVFLIELAIGQYSASGPATVWEVAPLFKGTTLIF